MTRTPTPASVQAVAQSTDAASERTAARRLELLERLTAAALDIGDRPTSLRQFAIRAGVSEPTLRHFFSDRQGVVVAILEHLAAQASGWLARMSEPVDNPAEGLNAFASAAQNDDVADLFTRAHSFALVEAIHDPVVARAYRRTMIDPSLAAIERRIGGAKPPAFAFYASMLLAILHQGPLGGAAEAPLDTSALLADLAQRLTRPEQPD